MEPYSTADASPPNNSPNAHTHKASGISMGCGFAFCARKNIGPYTLSDKSNTLSNSANNCAYITSNGTGFRTCA